MEAVYVALLVLGIPVILAIAAFYSKGPVRRLPRWPVVRKPSLSDDEFVERLAKTTERPVSIQELDRCAITWDFWALLADPLLTRELRHRFWQKISPTVSEVDVICVLSLPAAELIRPLMQIWKKPVLLPSQLAEWARSNPDKDQLAVVDIAIHAGYSLTMAMDRAADAGLRVRYVWLAMYNDIEDTLPQVRGVAKEIIGRHREQLVRTVLLRSELIARSGYDIEKRQGGEGLPVIKATPEARGRAYDLERRVSSAFGYPSIA